MAIYDILNTFKYQFKGEKEEEDYDRKWNLYMAPKSTLEKIDKQQVYLNKEQEKFI